MKRLDIPRWLVLCVGLAVAPLLFPAAAAAEVSDETVQMLIRQIEDLRREVDQLKRERPAHVEPAGSMSGRPAAPAPGLPPAAAAPSAVAVPAAPAPPAVAGPGSVVSSAGTESARSGVEIGGYGSVRYEASSPDDMHDTFTFRRFVLTADAPIAPRIRSGLELEFEQFRKLELERNVDAGNGDFTIEQEVGGTSDSEISLEQAWAEYDLAPALTMRAGGILVPLGRFNQNHDDDRWDIARRPLVDRGSPVLPATAAWSELGAGGLGRVEVGEQGTVEYQLYLVNGVTLEPSVETKLSTSQDDPAGAELEGAFKTESGTFGHDVKDAKAVAGRLAYSPALGNEIAASFYYGRYTPDYLPSEAIASFALDGIATYGNWELEGEYVFSDFGDVHRVAGGLAQAIGESESSDAMAGVETTVEFALDSLARQRQGYWLETRYDLRPAWLKDSIFGRSFTDPKLTLVGRAEQVWMDGLIDELSFSGGTLTNLSESDHRLDRWTIGAAYRPVPNAALQLAYEYTQVDHGSLSHVTNFMETQSDHAHTLLLGTVFGF